MAESTIENNLEQNLKITSDEESSSENKQHMYNFDDEEENSDQIIPGIKFVNYRDESQIHSVMRLVGKDLSEPYSSRFKL